ncbi:MAG: hypothetical protein AB9922_08085 [Bacteroidales bacterium]
MSLKLETKRLSIRPITLDDKEAIFRYRSDKTTNKYQGWIPEKVEEVVSFIGFRKEAHFVESLYLNGKWVDDLIFAMIEKDWGKQIHNNFHSHY